MDSQVRTAATVGDVGWLRTPEGRIAGGASALGGGVIAALRA
jgi:hypothetical protein